jgi:hypothetical protein
LKNKTPGPKGRAFFVGKLPPKITMAGLDPATQQACVCAPKK